MKKIYLFTASLVLSFSCFSQLTFNWAKSMGGPIVDFANKVTTDPSGNVLICGAFQSGGADFDPGPGTYTLPSNGSNEIHVTKLDASGNLIWAQSIGSTGDDQAYDIATDVNGNILVTGYFNGTVDFDPGAGVFNLTSAGSNDIFILKLTSAGVFVWAAGFGNTSSDYGNEVICDASGNVYSTGRYGSVVDFDPGPGVSSLTSAGLSDIYILKLTSAGSLVWVKSMGGGSGDEGKGIALDASGNIHTTGYFSGVADFDPGASTYTLSSSGSNDIFVSKLDNSGNFIWAVNMGGNSSDVGESVKVDASGNVFSGGIILGAGDFDPGAGTFSLTPSGLTGNFLSKLNSSGAFVWAKNFVGGSLVTVKDIDLDASGNVYSTGQFNSTCDFDPTAGTFFMSASGGYDGFISVLTNSGNYSWAGKLSGAGQEMLSGMRVSGSAIYVTGYYNQTPDFDAGTNTFTITTSGSDDIFLVRYDGCSGPPSGLGAIAGPSVICGSGSSAIYSVAPVTGASSYSWTLSFGLTGSSTSNTIYVTGTQVVGTMTVSAMNSCGMSTQQTKTITIDTTYATVNVQNICCFGACTGAATVTATGNGPFTYFWSNGASTSTINNLCASTMSVNVTSNLGCTVTNTLSITQPAPLGATVNASSSTLCAGMCATLSANVSGGLGQYSYSWSPMSSTLFAVSVCPTVSSTYTLMLSDSCCAVIATKSISVSTCTGIDEVTLENGSFDLYPNPAKGSVTVMVKGLSASDGKIYNSLGAEVLRFKIGKEETPLDISNLPKGIYFVQLGRGMKKIVVE
jgi:hypothetical protein